jgi:hypothetical protein
VTLGKNEKTAKNHKVSSKIYEKKHGLEVL